MISYCRHCNCGRMGLWKIRGHELVHLCSMCHTEIDRYDIVEGHKKDAIAFAEQQNEDAYPFDNKLQARMRVVL